MSDKKFDKILQEKLKGHQVKLGGPNWADMEKMLNETEHSESIDREVRNRLKNHTVEYKESHWQILKNKLELEKKLKEKIYLSKVAELSILALLLFSVFHFNGQNGFEYLKKSTATPFVSSDYSSSVHANSDFISTIEKDIDAEINTNDPAETLSNQSQLHQSKQTIKANTIQEASKINTSQISLPTEAADIKSINKHKTFGPITPESPAAKSKSENSASSKTTIDRIQSEPAPLATLSSPTIGRLSNNDLISINRFSFGTDKMQESLVSISKKSPINLSKNSETLISRQSEDSEKIPSHLLINSLQTTPSMPMANVTIVPTPHKAEKWIGVMTGVDINLIRRPYDPDKKVSDPENFEIVSMTHGVNYSIKKARNEFFTGIGYSEKTYNPALFEVFQISDSYYSRRYTLEKYNIIHVPAQYKRHLGDSHKIHAYVFGGVSMNFVIYTDYEQQDNLKRGQPRSKQIIDIKASYNDSGYSGLLEGGYYKDNIYFSADAGIGVEKRFKRTKFFFESQYKRNLFSSQLGPREVRLNSLSFNIGTKYRI